MSDVDDFVDEIMAKAAAKMLAEAIANLPEPKGKPVFYMTRESLYAGAERLGETPAYALEVLGIPEGHPAWVWAMEWEQERGGRWKG